MKKREVNLVLSIDEAKIIFDALSAHRYKIASKKMTMSEDYASQIKNLDEVQEFMSQRIMAIESEIEKTNEIFKKLGQYIKEPD
jgi:cupin superfamily acireductone dioxygenase involved in methionine salvage